MVAVALKTDQTRRSNKGKFMSNICVLQRSWEEAQAEISDIRIRVFVEEQLVPLELEFDGLDQTANHWLAYNSQKQPIATARLLSNGHIGRMAVLRPHRGEGVGSAIMGGIIAQAMSTDLRLLYLHAQLTAAEFYRRLGFSAYGEEFMDAGIPHIALALDLPR